MLPPCFRSPRTIARPTPWPTLWRDSTRSSPRSPDLERLVRSPVFSAADQLKGLDAVLAHADISGVAANFIRLVATKRRLFFIREMIADYRKLNDAHRGVTRAEVTSAAALTDANIAALERVAARRLRRPAGRPRLEA